MNAIICTGLKKSFRYASEQGYTSHELFRDISLELQPGKILAITGPNGVGKTVLAQCVTGLMSYDEGRITVDGNTLPCNDRAEALSRRIDYVPQHPPKLGPLTCEDFLLVRSPMRNRLAARRIIATQLRQINVVFDLSPPFNLRDSLASLSQAHLSYLYVIRTFLYGSPRILWLDEPFASLHRNEIERLCNTLVMLRDRGTAIVLNCHPSQNVHIGRVISDAYLMTNQGLIAAPAVSHAHLSNDPPRVQPIDKSWRCKVKRNNLTDTLFSIQAGEIFKVKCELTAEVDDFYEKLMNSTTPLLELDDKRERGAKSISVIVLPQNPAKSLLARSCSLLKNAVVGNWKTILLRGIPILLQKARALKCFEQIATTVKLNPSRDPSMPLSHLSGGNQHRFVVGRTLELTPDLIIGFNITQSLDDVGIEVIKTAIYRKAARGTAFILFTTDEHGGDAAIKPNQVIRFR